MKTLEFENWLMESDDMPITSIARQSLYWADSMEVCLLSTLLRRLNILCYQYMEGFDVSELDIKKYLNYITQEWFEY